MAVTHEYESTSGTIEVDFTNQLINCENTITTLEVQDIVNAAREAEYSATGIAFPGILTASGKEYLDTDNGVQVGITCVLLDNWKLYTRKTSGVFRVLGGNLVQVSGGDPFEANPLVTQINILSAASTVVSVSSGSGLSTAEHNQLMAIPTETLTTEQDTKLNSIPGETRLASMMYERENTIVNSKITRTIAGGDIVIDTTYSGNIPLTQEIES
jgi:hypothetical protein